MSHRFIFAILCLTIFTPIALAVNTTYWDLNNKVEIAKGDFENTLMTPAGEVALGRQPVKIAAPNNELTLWTGVADKKDTYYFGSASGKIYKLSEKENKLEEFFTTTETLVTSMAISSDNELFFATIPNGRIYKVNRDGKGGIFCQLPIAYVWKLSFGPDDKSLYASTGPVPNIYKIAPDGKFETFYEAKKGLHIMCLAFDRDNTLYFATSYPAMLYRMKTSPEKKAELLYDFGDNEIKSIALAADNKVVYLAINSGIKMMPQEFLGAVKSSAEEAKKTEAPMPISAPPPPPREKPPVQSSVFIFTTDNKVRELVRFDKSYLTDLKYFQSDKKEHLLASTDNSGKIFQIMPDASFAIPYDLDASNIMALITDQANELKALAAGGAGGIYLYPAAEATTGTYTSEVFDAKFAAEWGNISWENTKDITLSVRTGNTNKPDDTWSSWSSEITAPGKININPGRYIQVRSALNTKDAYLSKVSIAYLVANQQPRINDLRIEAVKKPLEGQQASPFMPQRIFARKIIYQAYDPDNDPLGYQIYYRKENQTQWVLLNQDDLIVTPEYIWNTESTDDGKYFIKVKATDERNNPESRSLTDSKTSKLVVVDNTKPTVKNLVIKDNEFSGEVEDNFNYIARIEYSLDGRPWETVFPLDNMFDNRTEKFSFQIKGIAPGTHVVALRVIDADGNAGIRQEEFTTK
ncbi:MAG: WD40 repeat domain-containing protein [Candidatus Brocadiia bacterium]